MKKILFVIGSMQLGGAEVVLTDIINSLSDKFDITLLLLEKRGPLLKQLNNSINLKYICLGKEYCNNFFSRIYNKIKLSIIYRYLGSRKSFSKFIHKYVLDNIFFDTEVAFLSGILADIVKYSPNKKSKKIAWIHCEVTKDDKKTYNKYLKITNGFDYIIGGCEASIEIFENTFPITKGKIDLIYNYVDVNKIINKANSEKVLFNNNKINFVSIGRLCDDKAFDRIINVAKKFEDKIVFNIIGDGPNKNYLCELIKKNNITNVNLLGLKTNPYPYIKESDYFLLCSRSEAYPTVVNEALILNKKIVATDVPGVQEMLKEYNGKVIIPNKDDVLEKGINEAFKLSIKKGNNKKFIENNEKILKKIIELLK